MSELDLLNALASGRVAFCRDEFPDLDEIDRELRRFAELGYIEKVVRAVYPLRHAGRRLMRADVVGGITPVGAYRRSQLLNEKISSSGRA
jgi:hypothetical protein